MDPAVVSEVMRSAAANAPAFTGEKKDEEKMSIFWRVFGGTILSIVALVSVTLFNNISSSIADLRTELGREREARNALAKKEDMDGRVKSLYERIRTVEAYKLDVEAIKERTSANAMNLESVKKDIGGSLDALRKETSGLDLLKDRVAAIEIIKKDVAAVEILKEKVASLTIDLKTARDESLKFQQELEKNKAADMERKASRDAQAKQIEETLKDLQKGLQDCREKLARLEGGQPSGTVPAVKTSRSKSSEESTEKN
jgi:DNA repair exonuclease SbcCD ATPase subunit